MIEVDWRNLLEQRLGTSLEPAVVNMTARIAAERPQAGRLADWRWRRRWQRAEARAFIEGGLYGSVYWVVLKRANNAAGVWGAAHMHTR